ncbi:TonB family protein [Pedobacter sp. SD-b]|uniref:TonB family protein n=1 Tax=Pedobacter segetis TaxID=2793069 RepID=A0ABS1BF39_9SPHI|nr:TonB family protein [Pedobacter segetis]MBK0381484.1 TonB family protein [Pedobacter segetis]
MVLSIIKLFFIGFLGFFQTDQPTFKGGKEALDSFIASKTIYPSFSKNNCIQGTIYVSFQLNQNGEVFGAKVDKGLGVDLDQEALRLVRLTNNKWDVPTNHNIKSRIIIPVNFSLKNYDCDLRSQDEVNKAIELYKTRAALEKVVTNYYKNKEEGKAIDKNEAEIIQIKAELGFDDTFISNKIKEAKKMMRQGDKVGACQALNFIKNIGSNAAESLIAENCK